MKKIGIGIDYSNICKNYNTAYLDRDNKDPATQNCMKAVVSWTKEFITALLDEFDYKIFKLNTSVDVALEEVASNRFLFYSLEKEITIQNYVFASKYVEYGSLASWSQQSENGVVIHNDEDGEGIYLYVDEGSEIDKWMKQKLADFTLDEAPALA